jgi:hypothetical protein
METIYIHDGVAYLSKDLALINGADELSLYTLKLNETQSEDINIIVSLNEVTFEDDYQNELSFKTTGGLEYMRIENGFTGLTKKLSNRIDSEIINFVDGFDEEDYFNED